MSSINQNKNIKPFIKRVIFTNRKKLNFKDLLNKKDQKSTQITINKRINLKFSKIVKQKHKLLI